MHYTSLDEQAEREGVALDRALNVPRVGRRGHCVVRTTTPSRDERKRRREFEAEQLRIAFSKPPTALNDGVCPAFQAYLNGTYVKPTSTDGTDCSEMGKESPS